MLLSVPFVHFLFLCRRSKQPLLKTKVVRKYIILLPVNISIADIAVSGIENYEDYVLIGLSGLSVGQVVKVPGDEITEALKRYWKHGLFSDVKILATKIEGNQIWLEVKLSPRPRISEIKFSGLKKTDREDLESKLGLVVGNQITPNIV